MLGCCHYCSACMLLCFSVNSVMLVWVSYYDIGHGKKRSQILFKRFNMYVGNFGWGSVFANASKNEIQMHSIDSEENYYYY